MPKPDFLFITYNNNIINSDDDISIKTIITFTLMHTKCNNITKKFGNAQEKYK